MALLQDEHPLLLPVPREMKLLGSVVTLPPLPLTLHGVSPEEVERIFGVRGGRVVENRGAAEVHCKRVEKPDVGAEWYALRVTHTEDHGQSPIAVEAVADEGLRQGLRTLAQLVKQYGTEIPALIVEDAPRFAKRGVMLDISRNRVPRLDELLACVDRFASLKLNYMELYMEHTFAYAGHEEVWQDTSALNAEDIRAVDAYARERGVTLGANQNCFGHMTPWLSRGRYVPLAEIQPGMHWEAFGQKRMRPFSLCPLDPGSLNLIEDLLSQLLPHFSGGWVNIGCDETLDVGQGRSKEVVARDGFVEVYFRFVEQVQKLAAKHGFKPAFWADIIYHHRQAVQRIPSDLTALVGDSEPDVRFEQWGRDLQEAGVPFWVCPGTSSWSSITGRTWERHGNLVAAAHGGASTGAQGYLVTDWGDNGHRQQWPVALQGIAEAANAAWNPEAADFFDARTASLHAFDDATGVTGQWLDELGDVDRELRRAGGWPDKEGKQRPMRNQSLLFRELHASWESPHKPGDLKAWGRVFEHLNELGDRIPQGASEQVVTELRHALDVARVACERAFLRREGLMPQQDAKRLAATMRSLIEEHRRLWLQRSRPGGLAHSCRHYEEVAKEFERFATGG